MDTIQQKELARGVGAAIAQARQAVGLTQEQVAEALGIGPEAVSRMERGSAMPSLVRLVQFAELFDCPAEQFFKRGSGMAADHASLMLDMIGPLQKADRLFVLDIVEKTCAHLRDRK